ncbi:shikimate dehydrogenase [soil metagenome]
MNDGKICVSVCAETADEMIANIKRAEEFADIVEVRFDCLDKGEFNYARDDQWKATSIVHARIITSAVETPLLTTFRTKDQGGRRELTELERNNFWGSGCETDYADFEEDQMESSWFWLWWTRICSFHNLHGEIPDISSKFDDLFKTDADVLKFASYANDVTDAIPVWNLIEKAKSLGKGIIPIAMGEAGKWTRILGLAHGAFLTYASLGSGNETAPGQVTSKDLAELYRIKDLDKDTKVYGVIGGDTSYSLSPPIHNAAFRSEKMNSVFVPLQVADLDEFVRRMVLAKSREVELNFHGFAVTNPHKQSIVKYLDVVDETSRNIGAVNTVKIEDGKLYGYNTDAHGFIEPLKNQFGDLRNASVAIVGSGGAARACIYALKQEGAEVTLFARNPNKAQSLADEFGITVHQLPTPDRRMPTDADIFVNTTPLGTKGSLADQTVAVAEQLRAAQLVYDLVYNPSETLLMSEAGAAGVDAIGGIEMLIAQGAKQFEIWTGREAPVDEMKAEVLARL